MENTENTDIVPIVKRPGAGRTKGSYSFVKIPISAILSKFADQTTPIVVSRKWAEACGFEGYAANPMKDTMGSIEGKTPETKVNVAVEEF